MSDNDVTATVTVGKGEVHQLTGDPIEVAGSAVTLMRSAVFRGETLTLVPLAPLAFCVKCDRDTANHEPRRYQATRIERGYFSCPICGYTKEGVIPHAVDDS